MERRGKRGHDERNIGRESAGLDVHLISVVVVIESGNEQLRYCWTDSSKKHSMTTTKSLALKRPLKFSQTITFFHTTCNLMGMRGTGGIDGIRQQQ